MAINTYVPKADSKKILVHCGTLDNKKGVLAQTTFWRNSISGGGENSIAPVRCDTRDKCANVTGSNCSNYQGWEHIY